MENNPILNSPYHEPRWHYATDLQGNLNYEDIRKDRRVFDPNLGGYSMPVMRQKLGRQESLENHNSNNFSQHMQPRRHEQAKTGRVPTKTPKSA